MTGPPDAERVEVVDVDGVTHWVSLLAYEGPTLEPDDYVVVHSGYALGLVEPEEAALTLAELARSLPGGETR